MPAHRRYLPTGGHAVLASALILLAQLHSTGPALPVDAPTLTAHDDGTSVRLVVDGRSAGPVEIHDGDRLVAVLPAGAGPAGFTTNARSGEHHYTAHRGGHASAPVDVGVPAQPEEQTQGSVAIVVVIPPGSLSLTSVTGPSGPRGSQREVTVTDTRAGNPGFQLHVSVDRRATLVGTRAHQVPGNAMLATDVAVARPGRRLAPGVPTVVASYPAGLGRGSVRVGITLRGTAAPSAVHAVWTVL